MSSSLQGLNEFERALDRLARQTQTRAIPKAIVEGLEAHASEVRSEAPLGRTGNLRGAIHVETPVEHGGYVSGSVSLDSLHAAAVDLGTHTRDANIFIQRAVRRAGPRVADAVARRIASAIEAEANALPLPGVDRPIEVVWNP